MSFEVEVRNSLRSIQAQVTANQQATDKWNASLRTTQTHMTAIAAGHRSAATAAGAHATATGNVANNLHGLGRAAKFAGGEGGALVGHLSHLASINPIAIGVGVAIGFVTNKITDMIMKAKEAREDLNKIPQAAEEGARAFAHKTLGEADTQTGAASEFDQAMGGEMQGVPPDQMAAVRRAAQMAVTSGRAKSEGEAIQRIVKSGLLNRGSGMFGPNRPASPSELAGAGMDLEDGDPARIAQIINDMEGSQSGQSRRTARMVQEEAAARKTYSGQRDLESAAGFNVAGFDQGGAAIANSPELTRQLDEMNKNIREQTAIMKAERGRSGWSIENPFASTAEEKLQELFQQRAAFYANVNANSR